MAWRDKRSGSRVFVSGWIVQSQGHVGQHRQCEDEREEYRAQFF